MNSKILQQDHKALIQLNRDLSPQERLKAFYEHSQLLGQLSLIRKAAKKKDSHSLSPLPPASEA